MYVTVGRIGSFTKKIGRIHLFRIGVKVYVPHVTRKGKAVLWYDGPVPGTVTVDRLIRPIAIARGKAYAEENGFTFRNRIVHNEPLSYLEALLSGVETSANTQENT